jgi:ankyrin repeat protein
MCAKVPDDVDASLGFAVWSENVERVRALLAAGADVNVYGGPGDTDHGKTPLMEAVDEVEDFVVERRLALIRLLIQAGAEPNRRDSDGRTALHYAAGAGASVVALLVEAGSSVASTDARGRTALHEAVDRLCLGAIETLRAAGADPSIVDSDGKRPIDLVNDAFTDAELFRTRALLA